MALRNTSWFIYLLALAGCEVREAPSSTLESAVVEKATPVDATPVPEGATTVEEFDTTSAVERQEALDTTGTAGRRLGKTVASLGDVAEPGIWIKTPLIREAQRGRVTDPARGTSVTLELLPLVAAPGSGSRLSLAAMRLLGAELTDLPELVVYALPD